MKKSIFLSVFALTLGFVAITGCGEDPNKPKTRDERIAALEESIRNTPEWLNDVKKKAEDRKIPLDTMIHLDAMFMVGNEDGAKPADPAPAAPAAGDKPAEAPAPAAPAAH